jgi:hypothetical protein
MWRASRSQVLSKESDIIALDLSLVEQRLIHRKQWAEEDARLAVRRYKNFLILVYKYPEHLLAPAPDMDEVWHTHLLFTREYTEACQRIFGGYLHHAPARDGDVEETARMQSAQQHTAELYRKEFQEPYLLELDILSLW